MAEQVISYQGRLIVFKLQPENDTMKPFYEKNVAVLGKVIGVYRQM